MSKIMNAVIYDNNSGFGGNLFRYLKRNGCEVIRADIEKPIRKSKIEIISPNVFLIALDSISYPVEEKVRKLRFCFPNAKIIIASYLMADKYLLNLLNAGADRCIIMPMPNFKVYNIMMELCGFTKIFPFENFIATFLIKNGFPSSTINFKYLCTAIGYCVLEPNRRFSLPVLYKKIAAANKSTYIAVERSLRRMSDSIFENGAYKNLINGKTLETSLTNYELLTVTTDKFIEYYNIPQ